MIQKTDISVLVFDSHLVFVIVVINKINGERDYSQQSLATCTVLRSCFRRGVVHIVLMFVKVQGVTSICLFCLFKIQKSCLYGRQKQICAHQTNNGFCISLIGGGQDRISQT